MNEVTEALIRWYTREHRDLPWRRDATPYHVWLSETMLQQTRVGAVTGYYERFLGEIPDIGALAAADEEHLLKLWEGLGYYARARNLKKAAEIVVRDHAGKLPDSEEELKKLPGIGDYTAGAVASIAFQKRAAAVDGNVLRVMARIRADSRDIALEATKRAVRAEIISAYLPKEDARCGVFNQALMELGAVVCVPNAQPLCDACPVRAMCLAFREGRQTAYPVKSAKKPRKREERTVIVLCDRTRVAIRKRPEKGLLAGLYEFPSVARFLTPDALRRLLRKSGIPALRIRALPDAVHVFTHIEWHMKGYLVITDDVQSALPVSDDAAAWTRGLFFARRGEIDTRYAMPSAFRAYTAQI